MVDRRWIPAAMIVTSCAAVGAAIGARQTPDSSSVGAAVVAPTEAAVASDGTWELGPFVVDAATTVDSAGGDVVVAAGALAGMTLSIPAGALPDATGVSIEHADIVGQTWGAAIQPVTPAIRVEMGGAYAADVVTVTVPVALAADELAMGFYVDANGALEGVPVVAGDRTSVRIATRHFSTWFLSKYDPRQLPTEIYTGYQMARDNWNFVNYGSAVAPGGICAGMTLSSAWYFLEQYRDRQDAAPLYGQYDYPHGATTPGFQWDDAHAYRFASMVQYDYVHFAGAWAKSFLDARYASKDRWQFEAFRYSMYVTGEPQLVALANRTGGGHAVLAYAVTLGQQSVAGGFHAGGNVWIADPNFPRQLNSIVFDDVTAKFQPYSTALSAGSSADDFPYIAYGAKTAFVDWAQIGQRFQEMNDGTIGNGVFPAILVWQLVLDPVTGKRVWVQTATPVAEADGSVTLLITVPGRPTGDLVLGEIFEVPAATRLASSLAVTKDAVGNASVSRAIRVVPGAANHTYKLIVWVQSGVDAAGNADLAWVDAVPLDVMAAPAATTTTAIATTVATTVAPTAPPTTAVPATTYPCPAQCPPGIAGVECSLHCGSISP